MKTNKKKYIKSLLGNICLAAVIVFILTMWSAIKFGASSTTMIIYLVIASIGWGLYLTQIEME